MSGLSYYKAESLWRGRYTFLNLIGELIGERECVCSLRNGGISIVCYTALSPSSLEVRRYRRTSLSGIVDSVMVGHVAALKMWKAK
jgi:hypothetical protein